MFEALEMAEGVGTKLEAVLKKIENLVKLLKAA